eukprot:PITA_02856
MTKIAGDNSPSFYVSLTIHDKILHNYLLDIGASHNLIPKAVMEELNFDITRPYHDLFSFDSRKVKCPGLIKDLVITLIQLPMKSMVMDIVVADIAPKFVFGGESRRLYREAQLEYIISDENNPSNHPIYAVDSDFGACILQIEESQKASMQLRKQIFQAKEEQGSQVWEMLFDGACSRETAGAAQKEDQSAVYKHDIGSPGQPIYINLSTHLSADQSVEYCNLMKQFVDVLAWEYSDLKAYDKKIIQHKIPIEKDTIPFK